MTDTEGPGLNAELLAAIPPDMHPYAWVFMHPPMDGVTPKFEPDEMNALGRHLERCGFRPVAAQMDRYEPPKSGPIHPHNPGRWIPKSRPRSATVPTVAERFTAAVDLLPEDQRTEVIASLNRADTSKEPDE